MQQDIDFQSEVEIEIEDKEPQISDSYTPFDTAKIDIIVKPMTISKLLDRLENNELTLNPDFQRASDLWDNKRKSRLIESIILRIPLPSFYFNEDFNGNYSVVDGLQRLGTIFQFINSRELSKALNIKMDDLILSDMQYLTDLNGKKFEDIPRNYKRIINELEITSTIIRPATPDLVRFNIFARLNQGGLAVNGQEIRNAIYPGLWRERISKIAKSKKFLDYTQNKISTKRLIDHQMILRVFALFATDGKRLEKNILDDFLNHALVKYIMDWDDKRWDIEEEKFFRGIKNTISIFGENAFRKLDFTKSSKSPINKTVFEIQVYLLGAGIFSKDQIDKLYEHSEEIVQNTEDEMRVNRKFFEALSSNTGSDSSFYIRKETFNEIFSQIVDSHDK